MCPRCIGGVLGLVGLSLVGSETAMYISVNVPCSLKKETTGDFPVIIAGRLDESSMDKRMPCF